MQDAPQILVLFVQGGDVVGCLLRQHIAEVVDDAPDAIEETVTAVDTTVAPFQLAFRRSSEEDKETGRIGTVF